MNYEQARQIGPEGLAPGKWNWTNANDSITPAPFTVAPCAWPDFDWPPFDPLATERVAPTGRERCDHDTAEEAERHHWSHELGRVQLVAVDLAVVRTRDRCDVLGCPNWEDFHARWPGGYVHDSLCQEHATHKNVVELHPFVAGLRSMHS